MTGIRKVVDLTSSGTPGRNPSANYSGTEQVRNDALEEAAKRTDAETGLYDQAGRVEVGNVLRNLAFAIRGLKAPAPSPSAGGALHGSSADSQSFDEETIEAAANVAACHAVEHEQRGASQRGLACRDVEHAIRALKSTPNQQVGRGETIKLEWRDGAPPKPWSEEWFIAETTFRDRVVLRSLPKDFTYDFKTADDTYIMRDKIKRWMQFPDSNYGAPAVSGEGWMKEAAKEIAAIETDGRPAFNERGIEIVAAIIRRHFPSPEGGGG